VGGKINSILALFREELIRNYVKDQKIIQRVDQCTLLQEGEYPNL